jgi:hypothetical protein
MAPRQIRPDQEVQVYVAVFKLYYPKMTISASIRKEGVEYAAFHETVYSGSTRLLQLKVTFFLYFLAVHFN